jgi:hypothetical protein
MHLYKSVKALICINKTLLIDANWREIDYAVARLTSAGNTFAS